MDRFSFPRYLAGSSEARKQRATCHGKGLPVKGRCCGSLALVFFLTRKAPSGPRVPCRWSPAPPSCTHTSHEKPNRCRGAAEQARVLPHQHQRADRVTRTRCSRPGSHHLPNGRAARQSLLPSPHLPIFQDHSPGVLLRGPCSDLMLQIGFLSFWPEVSQWRKASVCPGV